MGGAGALSLAFNVFIVARRIEVDAILERTPHCQNLTAAASSMAAFELRWAHS